MGKLDFTKSLVYRWRYILGYALIAIGLVSVLLFVALYLPGGISSQEMQSVAKSGAISPTNLNSVAIIDLPYHLLQKLILKIFGVSILSIKLPSIILSSLSIVAITMLLKLWFKANIGILASLIAITTGQFLFIAQDGTPSIIYIFWAALLMLLATLISRQRKFRKILAFIFFIATALSLYTPLSIYTLLALTVAVLIHPHLRYLLKQIPRKEIILGSVLSAVLLVPLVISIFIDPGAILNLIGIPIKWPDLGNNFTMLGAEYLGFNKPSGSTIMTPFFELGSMLIILIGIYYTIKNRATAQSHIIISWAIFLLPIVILNPNLINITFLPLVLMLASGLRMLLNNWYSLFPRNPYARIGGLVPLTVLVAVLIFSGADRYIHGYRYDPNIASSFSQDLKLIPQDTKDILVSTQEFSFYATVAKYNKNLQVTTYPPSVGSFLATKNSKTSIAGYAIDKIITNSKTNDSDRFYLYKKI